MDPNRAVEAKYQNYTAVLTDGRILTGLLAEEAVAVVPGEAFGESGNGFVRASYATAYEKIEEALTRIERFMRKHG